MPIQLQPRLSGTEQYILWPSALSPSTSRNSLFHEQDSTLYFTAMVTPGGLLALPIVNTTGTALPEATPGGTRTFT